MAAPLTPSQIATVKATAPVLKEHGVAITTLFYNNLLAAHPDLNDIFNATGQVTGAQPRALAAAVFAYASYVDNLPALSAAVERIAHKHASLGVHADQYPIVGKYLLEAVAAVLGPACTPEIAAAWTAAYGALADVFVQREAKIYDSYGAWKDWRRFVVRRKVRESATITSFHLAPEDGDLPLPPFRPGQYISLRIYVPRQGHLQPRQYSLSEAPRADYYRISVKKEAGKTVDTPGVISNMLHDDYQEGDVVEITHPTGDFYFDPEALEADAPVVLISAGVGITPMLAILNHAVDAAGASKRPVSLVHGAHSAEVRAFGPHIRDVCERNANVNATVFLTQTREEQVKGLDYHFGGRVDLGKLEREKHLFLHDARTQYYICGPSRFMDDMKNFLVSDGKVGEDRVHLEVFGVGSG
ncbi:flavohemo protein [Xylariomycetidae sp. FL0641]|nr:flavohemo protein [Xylariomycetidae sp. FL0641]